MVSFGSKSIADLPAALRLCSAAGGATLTLMPELAVALAGAIERANRQREFAAKLQAATKASEAALDAAFKAVAQAKRDQWRLLVTGMVAGVTTTVMALLIAGARLW